MTISVNTTGTLVDVVRRLVDADLIEAGDFPWFVTAYGLTADVEFPDALADYMRAGNYEDPADISDLWNYECSG